MVITVVILAKQVPKVTKGASGTSGTEYIQEYPEINDLTESKNPTSSEVPKVTKGWAEVLAVLDAQAAHPVDGAGTVKIWAADLLSKSTTAGTCPSCGQADWWTKLSGQRVCSICHPKPRRKV